MRKINMKLTKLVTLLMLCVCLNIFAAEYIDYKIRTDDFYADTRGEIGNEDISWRIKYKIGVSGTYSAEKAYYNQYECGSGAWWYRNTDEIWSGKTLNDNDDLYVYISAWDNHLDSGTDNGYDGNDRDYASDTDYDLDISANSRGTWVNFSSNDGGDYAGAAAGEGDYKVQFDIWWNWSLPVNPQFTVSDITDATFFLDLGSTNNYRVTEWGYRISERPDMLGASGNIITEDATITEGLQPGTTYYVQVRGNNEAGIGAYGDIQTFTTKVRPTVTTSLPAVADITHDSVKITGTVNSLGTVTGITNHGFCINTTGTPTISDTIVTNLGVISEAVNFQATIEGLEQNTTYYVRTFATDEIGTIYGNEVSFTTVLYTPAIGLNFIQNRTELSWTVEEEISVESYQIVDKYGKIIQTLIADGSGSYSITLDSFEDVTLKVVDNTGFSQTFLPEDGNIKITNYQLQEGWNLIAVTSENADLSELDQAWIWNGTSYETVENAEPTAALWVYSDVRKEISVKGTKTLKEISLKSGWNMVGPIENCKNPENAHTVYSWKDIYNEIIGNDKILIEGVGYWIFAL